MKKQLIISTIIALIFFIPSLADGQNNLKVRIGGNATRFMSEPLGAENHYFLVDSFIAKNGPFKDFTDFSRLGAEAEIMMSLTDKVWLGLEVGMSNLYGENDKPSTFNFQYTEYLELMTEDTFTNILTRNITNYPLKYTTSLIHLLGTFRLYPLPEGSFRPFIKFSAGVSLISTELALKFPQLWYDNVASNSANPDEIPLDPVLFSRGNNSEKGVFPAFTAGAGVGFEFQITPKIAAYADANLMMINADIVDGKPNWDYNSTSGMLTHFNTRGNTRKIGFGLVYTIGENMPILGTGRSSGKGGGRSGREHPYLPFYKIIN